HEEIPPHLHFHQPNPHIPWDQLPIQVPGTRMPWPRGNGRRLAGVSSFGFSGTNAHVVLEEAPALQTQAEPGQGVVVPSERPQHVLALSAKSEAALRELAQRYADWLHEH